MSRGDEGRKEGEMEMLSAARFILEAMAYCAVGVVVCIKNQMMSSLYCV